MTKTINEGLKELADKQYFDYSKVKNITLDYNGKKVKFRQILKNQAAALTKYNVLNYSQNRKALLRAFADGGTVGMFKYYDEQIAIELEKAEKQVELIKGRLNGKN